MFCSENVIFFIVVQSLNISSPFIESNISCPCSCSFSFSCLFDFSSFLSVSSNNCSSNSFSCSCLKVIACSISDSFSSIMFSANSCSFVESFIICDSSISHNSLFFFCSSSLIGFGSRFDSLSTSLFLSASSLFFPDSILSIFCCLSGSCSFSSI